MQEFSSIKVGPFLNTKSPNVDETKSSSEIWELVLSFGYLSLDLALKCTIKTVINGLPNNNDMSKYNLRFDLSV